MIITVNFQLKQLERRKKKKIRASTGFEPVTYAIHKCFIVQIFLNLINAPLTLTTLSWMSCVRPPSMETVARRSFLGQLIGLCLNVLFA